MKSTIERILLIRTDRIGDVVLTTPMATILRDQFPGIHITFMARPYTRPLLQQHRDIDDVLLYEPEGRHHGVKGHLQLAADLRARRFDAAILFYSRPSLAAVLKMANIPLRIGVGYRWYSFLLNRRIYEHRKHGRKHELEHNLTLLKALVPEIPESIRFEFETSPSQKEWRQGVLREMNIPNGYLILHPGSGGSAPNLSIEQYRRVARYLSEHSTASIVVTGLPQESALVQSITDGFDPSKVINAAGRFDMEQLMTMIAGAVLFLSSSTGPLHIANAFNVPVAGFYCPADPCSPRRWGPYYQLEWVLVPPVTPCNHCQPEKCPNGNCLEKIADTQLMDFLERRLNSLK